MYNDKIKNFWFLMKFFFYFFIVIKKIRFVKVVINGIGVSVIDIFCLVSK